MIKSILCIFEGSAEELNALNIAMILGKAHDAEIRILHASSDPKNFSGMIDYAAIVAAIEQEHKVRLKRATDYVSSFAQRHHLPLDPAEKPLHHASARFLHFTGVTDDIVARQGRISDVIVIGREYTPSRDLITPALFNTGASVLLMPQKPEESLSEWRDQTVALAWNGSLQSANALRRALPLLKRTEKLHVLAAQGHGEKVDLAEKEELMRYLRVHSLSTDVIAVDCGRYAAGEALLEKARELQADLLVMGAYGHSMFREMVLGGVTEYMLEKSDIPLLLSH